MRQSWCSWARIHDSHSTTSNTRLVEEVGYGGGELELGEQVVRPGRSEQAADPLWRHVRQHLEEEIQEGVARAGIDHQVVSLCGSSEATPGAGTSLHVSTTSKDVTRTLLELMLMSRPVVEHLAV
jgi:hypothetical protein